MQIIRLTDHLANKDHSKKYFHIVKNISNMLTSGSKGNNIQNSGGIGNDKYDIILCWWLWFVKMRMYLSNHINPTLIPQRIFTMCILCLLQFVRPPPRTWSLMGLKASLIQKCLGSKYSINNTYLMQICVIYAYMHVQQQAILCQF